MALAAATLLRLLRLLVCVAIVVLASANLPSIGDSPTSVEVDTSKLEAVEDLSESLANDLLELSVITLAADFEKTAEFFMDSFQAKPFPAEPMPLDKKVKWIETRGWKASSAATKVSKTEFMRAWSKFLSHFKDIEDARFKVKDARFDDVARSDPKTAALPTSNLPTGRARVAFYVIGRNQDGNREWTRGTFHTDVRQNSSGRWQFHSFELAGLESMVARVDLFSEVSVPAQVAARLPAYGTQGNSGFTWPGAAAGDFNQDGWIDLFVTAATRNYLYLNDRQGKFQDASEAAGVRNLASGVGPIVVDFDNDGDQDVFIAAVGSQVLLENRKIPDGRLYFYDVSLQANVDRHAIGFSAVSADVNSDGWPDVYVTSYNRYGTVTPDSWFRATNGTPNLLFINERDGTFREDAASWGVDDRRWSYAAAFADVNEDGRPDLYVVNDFGENGLYINRGARFENEAAAWGVPDPGNGMGAAFGDFNNDGRLDLHVTNMSSTAGNRILSRLFPSSNAQDNVLMKLAAGNTLFENLGNGKYQDVTAAVGGLSAGWAWGGGFIDFDNDGWEDLFTPNGFISGNSMKDT